MKGILKTKRLASLIIAVCILAGAAAPAAVAERHDSRTVIGADLTQEQVDYVYSVFGVRQGSVPQLTITNEIEHSYLDATVESSVIGTRSVSCVYVELLPENSGLDIKTANITWFTPEMYTAALSTAGIRDARIIVAAPFEVSGTAALAGIYWAYESMTGISINDSARMASSEELAVTGDLAKEVGEEEAGNIVTGIKEILEASEPAVSDDDVRREISEIAGKYGVSLSEEQVGRLLNLFRRFEDIDDEELLEKVREVEGTLDKVSEAKGKIEKVIETTKNIIMKIAQFVREAKEFFSKE